MRFDHADLDEVNDLDLDGEVGDGMGTLPLVAYDLMLPLLDASENVALPSLLTIQPRPDALRIAG